ncbi:MAG: methyltransferase [Bacteroidia bacterium]|nr:methyltransferase [Bacteroidia bacterium]
MKIRFRNRDWDIRRYPVTTNHTLQPWSAADEFMLHHLEEQKIGPETPVVICHDRFGFLACLLSGNNPLLVTDLRSQDKALAKNMAANGIKPDLIRQIGPLDSLPAGQELGLMKVPKSMDLFDLLLGRLAACLAPQGQVICGFMTRHFTPAMLEIAGKYFGEVKQSLAWKKSRLLILQKPKTDLPEVEPEVITLENGEEMRQYPGVFSGGKVDVATRFFLENMQVEAGSGPVLDLACGNGILGKAWLEKAPEAELHLLDDSQLALASAKLNFSGGEVHFHWNDGLEEFPDGFFEAVVCNPPFHLEHEIDISVALGFFGQVARCLGRGGNFQLVANRHLNYRTHLVKHFGKVELVAQNEKFEVLGCRN